MLVTFNELHETGYIIRFVTFSLFVLFVEFVVLNEENDGEV